MLYTIRTDSVLAENISASSADDAVRQFCATESGMEHLDDLAGLREYIEAIDAAWCWIEDSDGARTYIAEENMR